MPLPLLELPAIAAAFLLHPSQNPPVRPISCASQQPGTIADCCVHFRDGESSVDRISGGSKQPPAEESEGRATNATL